MIRLLEINALDETGTRRWITFQPHTIAMEEASERYGVHWFLKGYDMAKPPHGESMRILMCTITGIRLPAEDEKEVYAKVLKDEPRVPRVPRVPRIGQEDPGDVTDAEIVPE